MDNYEFLELLFSNYFVYSCLLVVSLLLYYILFRKIIYSIFDPFALPAIYSAIGFATVFFLFFCLQIGSQIFFSYLVTQFAFLISFLLPTYFFSNRFKAIQNRGALITSFGQIVFFEYYYFFFLLICNISVYMLKGIPLFQESRLDMFSEGGGSGILSRILNISNPVFFFIYSIKVIFKRNNLFDTILFGIGYLFLSLSGSKSALLFPIYMYFSACLFTGKVDSFFSMVKRYKWWLFSFFLIAVLLVVGIQISSEESSSDLIGVLTVFGLRFLLAGDIYWYSYPNDTYTIVPQSNILIALFQDFFGLFRIIDWSQIKDSIGYHLYQYHHPTPNVMGPNGRHNVFGLIYCGYWGSILLSAFLGILTFFSRTLFHFFSFKRLFVLLFTVLFFINAPVFEMDPMLAFTYLNNIIFVFLPLHLIGLCIFYTFFKKLE